MERKISDKLYLIQFNSLNEVVEYIHKTEATSWFKSSGLYSERNSEDFTATRSLDEAENLLINGWSKAINKIKNYVKNPDVQMKKMQKEFFNDCSGFQAIVPNYLMGLPKSMVNSKFKVMKQKVLTINVNGSYSCRTSTDLILENASRQVALVMGLENQGYRVNVNVCYYMKRWEQKNVLLKIRVKDSSVKLNLAKMSFALAHPSMLRRIVFAIEERNPIYDESFTYCYGTPVKTADEIKERFGEIIKNEICLPSFITEQDLENKDFLSTL